jgi:hypothetical protein
MSFDLDKPEVGVEVITKEVEIDTIKLVGLIIQLKPGQFPRIRVRWAKGYTKDDQFIPKENDQVWIDHPVSTQLISTVVTPGNTRAQEVEKAAFEYLVSIGKIASGEVE